MTCSRDSCQLARDDKTERARIYLVDWHLDGDRHQVSHMIPRRRDRAIESRVLVVLRDGPKQGELTLSARVIVRCDKRLTREETKTEHGKAHMNNKGGSTATSANRIAFPSYRYRTSSDPAGQLL